MKTGVYGIAGAVDPKMEHDGKIDLEKEVESFLEGFSESDKLKQIFAYYALKSNTPSRISVTDITALTADQLDALRCGDQVIKQTGTMNHCYTVSYKDETVGGLCLTYCDCENVETVAYEKVDGVWTYQSTDITHIGN